MKLIPANIAETIREAANKDLHGMALLAMAILGASGLMDLDEVMELARALQRSPICPKRVESLIQMSAQAILNHNKIKEMGNAES